MAQLDCTQARDRIEDLLDGYLAGETAAEVRNHIAACEACTQAHAADEALRAQLGRMSVPAMRPDFAAEAFAAAARTTRPLETARPGGAAHHPPAPHPTHAARPARRLRWRRPELWVGAALGAAAAAALVAVLWGIPQGGSAPGHAPGQVAEPSPGDLQVSLYETRDVGIAIDAATAMPGAILTVTVAGGIELAGFGDRREVQWQSDLDAGTNLLSLPIIAHSLEQGRLTALVEHGDRMQRIELAVRVSDPMTSE